MVDLGLNSHHQTLLLSFMKFARYIRGQTIKTVENTFDTVEREIYDDTYTQEEVKQLFNKLHKLVLCDVEEEVLSFGHYNVVMLQQLFQQAEKCHLRLDIQLSELQNLELLEKFRELENNESLVKPAKEVQIDDQGSIALMRLEIQKLQEENRILENGRGKISDELERKTEELEMVQKKLSTALKNIQEYRVEFEQQKSVDNQAGQKELDILQGKLNNVENLLQIDGEASNKRQKELEKELYSTKGQILQVQAQLKLAEEELERKFSETKAYGTMKQILHGKNEQIKKLRARLNEEDEEESLE